MIFLRFAGKPALVMLLATLCLSCTTQDNRWSAALDPTVAPYNIPKGIESRSVTFENPTGAKGEGGKAAGALGVGRKGSANKTIEPGETLELCDIRGSGTIRHLWMTTEHTDPRVLRSLVIRAYWDGQEYPSIACPLGDFMGFSHGSAPVPYQSAVHSVGQSAAMNLYLPMPFVSRAHFTLTNDGEKAVPVFVSFDYTLGERHPKDVGRLHVLFRRENPTTAGEDYTILPTRTGRGRYLGAVIGVRIMPPTGEWTWWGEGEAKIYLDGDKQFPTVCGTGSEDYVGLAWGLYQTPFLYHGCSLISDNFVSMYRWHLPDPVYWQQSIRVTIQQLGWGPSKNLFERVDDWCSAAFWYEQVPSAPLPELPDLQRRVVDILPAKTPAG